MFDLLTKRANKSGFICDNVEEAAKKIKDIENINRQDCFDHVNQKFSAKKMAEDYLEAYEKVIKQGQSPLSDQKI